MPKLFGYDTYMYTIYRYYVQNMMYMDREIRLTYVLCRMSNNSNTDVHGEIFDSII